MSAWYPKQGGRQGKFSGSQTKGAFLPPPVAPALLPGALAGEGEFLAGRVFVGALGGGLLIGIGSAALLAWELYRLNHVAQSLQYNAMSDNWKNASICAQATCAQSGSDWTYLSSCSVLGSCPSNQVLAINRSTPKRWVMRMDPDKPFNGQLRWKPRVVYQAALATPYTNYFPLPDPPMFPRFRWKVLPRVPRLWPGDAGYDPKPVDKPVPPPTVTQRWKPGKPPTTTVEPTQRKPPKPKEKEKKRKSRLSIAYALFHEATEWSDLVDSFYKALPKEYRLPYVKGKPIGLSEKVEQVYKYWGKVDLDTALFNLLWNEVEDRVVGHTVGSVGNFFSDALGGGNAPLHDVTLGPVGQDSVGEPIGRSTAKAKKAVKKWLNEHTNLSIN